MKDIGRECTAKQSALCNEKSIGVAYGKLEKAVVATENLVGDMQSVFSSVLRYQQPGDAHPIEEQLNPGKSDLGRWLENLATHLNDANLRLQEIIHRADV